MCLRQKIYCDSNSTKNVGCNNSYSNSTSSLSFWTHQPTWYESVYWSKIRYSLPALCPPILHFCQKCLNARQKLGTRNSKVWMLLKTVKNLKNSKVTHSHSLTLGSVIGCYRYTESTCQNQKVGWQIPSQNIVGVANQQHLQLTQELVSSVSVSVEKRSQSLTVLLSHSFTLSITLFRHAEQHL